MNKGVAFIGYFSKYYLSKTWKDYNYLISIIVSMSQPGQILDLGAGLGFLGEAALNWGLSCICLEGSKEAIDLAKKRNQSLDIRNHLLSESLPFPKNSIQTIILNQVIEHLEPELFIKVLNECLENLKSGGLIYISSPNKYNRKNIDIDTTRLKLYSPSELEALVKSAGFIKVKPMNYNLSFLGKSYIASKIAGIIFRYTKWDRISATANLIAFKP